MKSKLSAYIGYKHIDLLQQLGDNEHFNGIYLEILDEFRFLMQIHVDSFFLTEKDPNVDYGTIGYLPDGMIRRVAETIDDRFIDATIPLKTCIWYEISTQLVQQSVFRMNCKR